MRDLNSGVWGRKQRVERAALAPVVGAVKDDAEAEPMFTERLCKVIVAFWAARGVTVKAWPEHVVFNKKHGMPVWRIRSIGIPGAA